MASMAETRVSRASIVRNGETFGDFVKFPAEILDKILYYLGTKELRAMMVTNKTFNKFIGTPGSLGSYCGSSLDKTLQFAYNGHQFDPSGDPITITGAMIGWIYERSMTHPSYDCYGIAAKFDLYMCEGEYVPIFEGIRSNPAMSEVHAMHYVHKDDLSEYLVGGDPIRLVIVSRPPVVAKVDGCKLYGAPLCTLVEYWHHRSRYPPEGVVIIQPIATREGYVRKVTRSGRMIWTSNAVDWCSGMLPEFYDRYRVATK